MVYWDYYHSEPQTYEEYLKIHQTLSGDVVCRGRMDLERPGAKLLQGCCHHKRRHESMPEYESEAGGLHPLAGQWG